MDAMLLLLAGVVALGALVVLGVALSARKRLDQLTRPSARLGDVSDGPVKLEGRADSEERFESRVSNKPCIYLRVVVRNPGGLGALQPSRRGVGEIAMSGHMGHGVDLHTQREDLVHELKPHSLTLEDGDGQVEVELEHADIELAVDRRLKSGLLEAGDPRIEGVLRRFSIDPRSGGSWQLTETILEPGDRVLVSGRLVTDRDGHRRVVGDADNPVYLTDLDTARVTAGARNTSRWGLVAAVGLGLLAVLLFGLAIATGGQDERLQPGDDMRMRSFEP